MATATVLSPTIPAAPIGLYPSSPIMHFPPAVPSTSRPLRERCGVNLRICTSTSGSQALPPLWSPKGHIQPHRSNLPRRRKVTKKRFVLQEDPEDVKAEERKPLEMEMQAEAETKVENVVAAVATLEIGQRRQESYLQEVIPGLFIAFANGTLDEQQPGLTLEKSYTHIVNIVYSTDPDPSFIGGSDRALGRVQILTVTLPALARTDGSQRAGLGLTDAHLRTVRDFIGEALPYELASSDSQKSARVLITTPHGRPVDAMCAAGVYLAFISGQKVDMVLRYIDEEEDFLSIWKGEVSGEEVEKVEKIARAWSWLSQLRAPRPC